MPKSTWVKEFAKSTDFFANGVSLSYNGARKHHTLAGGICSIIVGLLIALQMYTTFTKYYNDEYTNVVRNNHELLLDQSNPLVYNITRLELSLLNNISSTDKSIINPEMYFSGVYYQQRYELATG